MGSVKKTCSLIATLRLCRYGGGKGKNGRCAQEEEEEIVLLLLREQRFPAVVAMAGGLQSMEDPRFGQQAPKYFAV